MLIKLKQLHKIILTKILILSVLNLKGSDFDTTSILKKIDFAYGLDYPLAFRRLRPKSLSYNKFISAKYQFFVYYNYEKFNIVKSFYYLFRWFIAGIMKHFKNYGL